MGATREPAAAAKEAPRAKEYIFILSTFIPTSSDNSGFWEQALIALPQPVFLRARNRIINTITEKTNASSSILVNLMSKNLITSER